MLVSIIIPCYKEQSRLPSFLQELHKLLGGRDDIEFIIVDDGSPLELFEQLKSSISPFLQNNIQLYHYEINQGKGNAIAFGLEKAKAETLGFVDSDGAIPAYEVKRLIDYALENPNIDLIAGSRILMLGKKVERGIKRHISNRIFATYFSNLFGIKMYDSQCGCKIFRKKPYELIKSKIIDKRWLWDTQLVVQFYKNSYKLEEVPIDWIDQAGSKVSLISDSIKMFVRLFKYRLYLNKDT